MKYMRNIILGWLCVCLTGACSDFLEEKSQDEVLVRTASDYSELLLGYMGYSDCWRLLYLLSDETRLDDNQYWGDGNADDATGISYKGFYTWQPDMWEGTSSSVTNCYKEMYELIMGVNAVLDGIDRCGRRPSDERPGKGGSARIAGILLSFPCECFRGTV